MYLHISTHTLDFIRIFTAYSSVSLPHILNSYIVQIPQDILIVPDVFNIYLNLPTCLPFPLYFFPLA